MSNRLVIGVDTGGTFTDLVVLDGTKIVTHKVLSTPAQPDLAILRGVEQIAVERSIASIVHGSTVATNAILEGKGARTVFITNAGFTDLLSIGRQARRDLYELQPKSIVDPVPAQLCLEVDTRCDARGQIIQKLSDSTLHALVQQVQSLAPQAVAINLLFSYLDDSAERKIEQAMSKSLFVCRSSVVLAEYKEYERAVATWLNARVGPVVSSYLMRLQAGIDSNTQLVVMQSAGGVMKADHAGSHGVQLLLSGPAGGLMGARFVGQQVGQNRLLTFDMGGTSTDVAIIDGEIHLTTEGEVAGYPVCVPMVDMHTIGAGGGSVARLDEGGLLQVGPESAGAQPGPACYAKGGDLATVTDANLILGRIQVDTLLGGEMGLDRAAACRALQPLAAALNRSIEEAALGIIDVANEHMVRALRLISVERGLDPREYMLVSFGGAGGLHVCALAQALGMQQAMVPVHAGVLSALGMLTAPLSRHYSRTLNAPLASLPTALVEQAIAALAALGCEQLAAQGVAAHALSNQVSVDLCYQGQSHTLNVPWSGRHDAAKAFHDLHQQRYGHCLDVPVELVNVRVYVRGPFPNVQLAQLPDADALDAPALRDLLLYGVDGGARLYRRDQLSAGHRLEGPALVVEDSASTYLAPGWVCHVDQLGNLRLSR